jgi:phospholipid/cholesterol/gamma-HCH transport system substrate-binding protein
VKLSRELKTGILVTITIALFIYGFNVLKGRHIFSPEMELYAIYTNIDGLVVSNPVLINGFKVGQVRDVYLHPDNSGKIIVKMVISETKFRIPDSTVAKIISSDLLGSKAVQFDMRPSPRQVVDGDTLMGNIEEGLKDAVNKQIEPIKKKAEALLSSIDSVMTIVQTILNKDARNSLTASFESVKRALATFEKTAIQINELVGEEKSKISSILNKIEIITSTVAKNSDKISNAMNNLSNITDSISKSKLVSTINNTNKMLMETSALLEKVNKGEGSLGLLINDKKLYNDLDSASMSLNSLIKDMEDNPYRYFSLFANKKKRKKPKTTTPPG